MLDLIVNMRLKLFESFETEDYYIVVPTISRDVQSFGLNPNGSSLRRFTDREKLMILKNIPKTDPTSSVYDKIEWDEYFCCLSIRNFKGFNNWYVYRWGDDDWIWAYNDSNNISYRCDHFEGLLLKDKWIK